MELTSKRLIYRCFDKEEFDRYYSVISNPQIMRYALMDYSPDKAAEREKFEKLVERGLTLYGYEGYMLAAYRKEDGAYIGMGDVQVINKNETGGCADVGYFLLPEYWGQGYASEIAQALCGLCFGPLELHRVVACCHADNKGSEQVMRKIGMQLEGRLRKERPKDGGWHDELRYGLLAEEWNAQQNK